MWMKFPTRASRDGPPMTAPARSNRRVGSSLMGARLPQVTCDRPREDLRQSGQYGDGNHGFAYRFPTPLPTSVRAPGGTVLAIRIAAGQRRLPSQQCRIDTDTTGRAVAGRRAGDDGSTVRPALDVRTPGLVDERLGLAPLLSRLDLDGHQPRQVHYGVFAMPPQADSALAAGRTLLSTRSSE